jgi:hypothetical protein
MEVNTNNGQFEIVGPFGSVFLYTHDMAHHMVHTLYDVLSKKEKWNDPDYFTRMLFCRMVPKELWYSNEKFGIGTQMYADIKYLITIHVQQQKILMNHWDEYGIISHGDYYTYEEFLNNFANKASL